MGNCLGLSSAATEPSSSSSPHRPADASPPAHYPPRPTKKQRKDDEQQQQQQQQQPFVTDQVVSLRDQAAEYHEKVVACAKRSQDAYRKGDKGEAHEQSEQKKNWQSKRDEANRKAARIVLQAQKWETTGEIDLHGLHLNEATDAARDFLRHWSKKSNSTNGGVVTIITGAGHHSENNKAVIRPNVERMLQEQGLTYKSVHGDGAFEVTIKPSQ